MRTLSLFLSPFLALGLASTAHAVDPSVTFDGPAPEPQECPNSGQMTLTFTGFTPNGEIKLLRGTDFGNDTIPTCNNLATGLKATIVVQTTLYADANGNATMNVDQDTSNKCGMFLQALDVSTCQLSADFHT